MTVATVPLFSWRSPAWRCHDARFPADSWEGSRYYTGRFHRAPDLFAGQATWLALYTAAGPEVALGEAIRYLSPTMRKVADYRLTELSVTLVSVLDLRDPAAYGIDGVTLLDDWDYSLPHNIAEAALRRGADGVLVPSATRLGHNIIVLPDNLIPGVGVAVTSFRSLRHVLRD